MHSDLTFFTNEPNSTLLERFKNTLRDVETFDVLVGYFRTSGFYRLYESLEDIKKIRVLVGINTDKKTYDLVQSAQTKFDFESHTKAKEDFSKKLTEEVYQSEDKYDVEVGIKKFIEFIQTGKLEIKAYPSKNLHAKVYISRFKEDDRDYGRVITGSSNFSEYGLNANYEFNVELKNSSDVRYAEDKFEELWKDAVDLSEVYVDTINQKTWLNDQITPYEIYLKFLYEYLKEEIKADDDFKTYLPDGFMELKYQKNAVTTLKKIVDQYGGAFVADVVGLGKTYITAMYAQALPGKKLVICPPPIKDNWEEAFRDFGIRNFEVESIGRLEHIIKKGVERYDYIFIDEAHRFRNENTNQYQLLHQICLNKKILLISATPLNNSVYDFFSLLKLFQKPTDSDIPDVRNLETFFTSARQKLLQYDKSDPEYLEEVKRISKQVRDKILKHVMVRRTRTDVMKYFPFSLYFLRTHECLGSVYL
jgi:HKD family nuclease